MKEHVVTGLTHFSIMTDNYMPGMAASDDVTILSAEYTPSNRYLRIYIPVHAGQTWDLVDHVIKTVRDYKDENYAEVASYGFSKLEDWEGPNSPTHELGEQHPGYCALRRRCYISIRFSGNVDQAQSQVEAFRTFLMTSLKEFYPM